MEEKMSGGEEEKMSGGEEGDEQQRNVTALGDNMYVSTHMPVCMCSCGRVFEFHTGPLTTF